MLVLTEKQVTELEAFIQELPVKIGVPMLNLFRKFSQEAATEANGAKEVLNETPKVSNGLKVAEIEAE